MTPPKTQKQVRALIGLLNYYMEMWPKRSHLLHPLTALTSNKAKFKYIDIKKRLMKLNE